LYYLSIRTSFIADSDQFDATILDFVKYYFKNNI
jgi:hypothetical protein